MKSSSIPTVKDNLQGDSVAVLTQALETMIQELVSDSHHEISVFMDGTEIYRYQASNGKVFWWGIAPGTSLSDEQTSCISSH